MSKLSELTAKLREVLQIDRPDLDFGVYRIVNARSAEITGYLTTRLPARVHEALSDGGKANLARLEYELTQAVASAQGVGVDPESTPRVAELRAEIASAATQRVSYETSVYSHLLTFFSRYYSQGDFVSQRRYKGDTYAIPYAGEEVLLHWANRDQYYTKSGEAFSNYSFRTQDGRIVHCRLVSADTAKDNRKDNDQERRYVLVEPGAARDLSTGEESFEPVSEEDGELVLRFAYRPMPKGSKQADLNARATTAVLDSSIVKARWQDLTRRSPTDKAPLRSVLEKHLTDFTARNTADYFIHKDLGGFLRRELDFYIKNEVMNLDDIQNADAFSAIETNLRLIQTLRSIALDLIDFVAQLEDFQKRIWLKKKLVVAAHYCMTLDRVPQALWEDVASNPEQWAQWRDLGLWDGADGTSAQLGLHPHLMVDTAVYDASFRAALLKSIPDLDASINGVLIHGDNFQALQLLGARYAGEVQCTYIDPPYNATTSEIFYKNFFKHSSWATLMANRLDATQSLLAATGSLVVAIDENEREVLGMILKERFALRDLTCVSVVHNPRGIQGSGFSYTNEFAYFSHPQGMQLGLRTLTDTKSKPLMKTGGESARSTAKNCFYPIIVKDGVVVGFGDVPPDNWHPVFATEVNADGTQNVWPISSSDGMERKWRYARQSVEAIQDNLEVKTSRTGEPTINLAKDQESYRTVWSDAEFNAAEYGSTLLKNIVPAAAFSFPKSLHTVRHSLTVTNVLGRDLVLDYFAGSGTTGHAVIAMNREDAGDRRYILVEQGEYFDTVLKPRLQKVVYSAEWKEGRPTAPETGISHAFKVLKIESYEDALNNLVLARSGDQETFLGSLSSAGRDDYMLRYMLDVETRGSLLSIKDFRKPFDYRLQVAIDSAGAAEPRTIDLVETFNYLLGLKVKNLDLDVDRGFAVVTGVLPTGQSAMVVWRDCERLGYEDLNTLFETLAVDPAAGAHDVIFINGDHALPSISADETDASVERRNGQFRQIEPVFLDAMFTMDAA